MRKLLVGFILLMSLPLISMAEEQQAPAAPAEPVATKAAPAPAAPAAAASVGGRVKDNTGVPAVPFVAPSGYLPYNPSSAK